MQHYDSRISRERSESITYLGNVFSVQVGDNTNHKVGAIDLSDVLHSLLRNGVHFQGSNLKLWIFSLHRVSAIKLRPGTFRSSEATYNDIDRIPIKGIRNHSGRLFSS